MFTYGRATVLRAVYIHSLAPFLTQAVLPGAVAGAQVRGPLPSDLGIIIVITSRQHGHTIIIVIMICMIIIMSIRMIIICMITIMICMHSRQATSQPAEKSRGEEEKGAPAGNDGKSK